VDVEDVEPQRAERIARGIAEVVQERQTAQMVSVPEPERVYVAMLDRPSPGRLVWPDARSILLAAALLGALAGGLIAFVLDFLDDTIRSPKEAERCLGLPVVGVIPQDEFRVPSFEFRVRSSK
jgi:capsular polysaccharide biosynthesis protein